MSGAETGYLPGHMLKLAELRKFFSGVEESAVPQVLLQCSTASVESLLRKLDEIMRELETIRGTLVTAILRDYQTALMQTSPSKAQRRQQWMDSRRRSMAPEREEQQRQQRANADRADSRGDLNQTVKNLQDKKLIPSRLVSSVEAKLDAFRRNLDKLQRSSQDLVVQVNCLMLAGGYGADKKALIFKEAENEWSSVAPLGQHRFYSAAAECNGKVVLCGGASLDLANVSSAEQFCAKTNAWSPLPDLLDARAGHAMVNAAGSLYVIGGWNENQCLRSVERYDAEDRKWKRLANMNTEREGLAATSYENIAVVTGGFDAAREVLATCEVYDVKKRLWRFISPLNIGRAYHAAASHAGVLYVFGGRNKFTNWTSVAETEQYDRSAAKWTVLSPLGRLRVARCELAAACVRGRIYLVGGCEDPQFLKSDVVEYFDTLDRQIYSARPLPLPCRAQVAVSVNMAGLSRLQVTHTEPPAIENCATAQAKAQPAVSGNAAPILRATFSIDTVADRQLPRASGVEQSDGDSVTAASQSSRKAKEAPPKEHLICVGGWSSSENCGTETLIFDGEGKSWKAAAQTAFQHAYTAATEWDGKVVVCGNSLAEADSVEQFDPHTNTWSPLAKLQVGRHGHSLLNLEGNLYAIGGWNGEDCLSSVERYDAQTQSWQQVATLITARKFLAGAKCKRFLIVSGGKNSANYTLSSCELYDPASNLWSVMAPMNTSRYLHAAVSHRKSVYVFGGSLASKSMDGIEQFKAGSSKWTVLKTRLSTARFELAAACVNDKIYIVGGCEWRANGTSKSKRSKLDVVDCFDPKLKHCSRVSQLPQPCRGLAAASFVASLDLLDRDKRESYKSFTYLSLENEQY